MKYRKTLSLTILSLLLISSLWNISLPYSSTKKENTIKTKEDYILKYRDLRSLRDIIIVFKNIRKAKEFARSQKNAVLFDPLPIVYVNEMKDKDVISTFLPHIKCIRPNLRFKLQLLQKEHIKQFNPLSEATLQTINATPLHDRGFRGEGIRVAIIDSGINNHTDLKGKIVLAKSFVRRAYGYPVDSDDTSDSIGHGTYVAGVIASNGTYIGVAPDARLINAKVFYGSGSNYVATEAGIIAAIRWVVTEASADVINLSLGGPALLNDPLLDAVEWAAENGVIVVVAAGNEGEGGLGTMQISTPGVSKYAITVGATDENGNYIASYSSLGPIYDMSVKPDIVAPGAVISTSPTGGYDRVYGTSFATPHVAGSVALLLNYLKSSGYSVSKNLELVALIKTSLMSTARSLDYSDLAEGSGLIDVGEAWWLIKKYIDSSSTPDFFTILPKRIPAGLGFPYYSKLFLGMNIAFNITLYSSIPRDVKIIFSGNVSDVFGANNISIHVSIPFTNWEFNFTIPENASIGYYKGKILFLEGSKILYEIPIEFNLAMPRGFILFDLRHTSWIMDAKYGQYREYFKLAEEMGFAVEQLFWTGKEITKKILKKYDLVFMPDASSYYTQYDSNGTALGLISKTLTKNEIVALKEYVDEGGFIIYISMIPVEQDSGNNITNVNEFAKEFGVEYKTEPLILQENPIPSTILETPIFGIGNETVPFNGVPLVIKDPTKTKYFLKFTYFGRDYYGGAIYFGKSGGIAMLLSTNFFFDNWAFNGRYSTSPNEADDVREVHKGILGSLGYKRNIIITPLTKNPKLGDVVEVNITIVNLTYTSLRVYVSDLIGQYRVKSVERVSDNTYIASFTPRHARYVSVIAEVTLVSNQTISRGQPIYIEPLESNKPNLVEIDPVNDTRIETDLYDKGVLSFRFVFDDDSKMLVNATRVSVYVLSTNSEEFSSVSEIPYNITVTPSSDEKEITVEIQVSKSDIVNAVFLAKEIELIVNVEVYDINANSLYIRSVYTILQKGGLGIYEIGTILFIIVTLVLIIAILLKFKKEEENVIYISR